MESGNYPSDIFTKGAKRYSTGQMGEFELNARDAIAVSARADYFSCLSIDVVTVSPNDLLQDGRSPSDRSSKRDWQRIGASCGDSTDCNVQAIRFCYAQFGAWGRWRDMARKSVLVSLRAN